MKENIKFNSQICTTKEQSEKLLKLGLNSETADMHHYKWSEGYWDIYTCPPRGSDSCYIPAWSLHRLLEIICNKECKKYYFDLSIDYDSIENVYDSIIEVIERHIKENRFNKEYLKQ